LTVGVVVVRCPLSTRRMPFTAIVREMVVGAE